MKTSTLIKEVKCECADHHCKDHANLSRCHNDATNLLYRVDMQDETGTALCDACSDDAFAGGLFTTKDDEEDDCQAINDSNPRRNVC